MFITLTDMQEYRFYESNTVVQLQFWSVVEVMYT